MVKKSKKKARFILSLALDPGDYARIKKIAEVYGEPISTVLRLIIRAELPNLERDIFDGVVTRGEARSEFPNK